ncbi:hypothetical protein NKR19_g4209 [Coniochaeta hoffmannii]|uniref:Uncharacterized protein n=1 Tax=Coniochaeta hoffmannii TaxID=91930 RepID=A0AA38RU80_9PEZI|nr:hypothetical protein NKR19_g4209 [Coniochaeta hoffmannii]
MSASTSPYSRDAAVASIQDFYLFLTRLPCLSPSDIKSAPPPGWPELTDSFLGALGKTPVVNDLIRHLPYISSDGESNVQIAPETSVIRWDGPDVRWSVEKGAVQGTLSPFGAGDVPAHVCVLTEAGRYGSWLMLDTEAGTITDYIQFEKPERQTPGVDSPDHWRAYRTLPLAEFFEEWKDKYRRLEWVVVPEDEDDGVRYRFDAETDDVREIYRQYGWPDAFRRDDCREALKEWHDSR